MLNGPNLMKILFQISIYGFDQLINAFTLDLTNVPSIKNANIYRFLDVNARF